MHLRNTFQCSDESWVEIKLSHFTEQRKTLVTLIIATVKKDFLHICLKLMVYQHLPS
jgi:hypothetical protein